MSGVASLARLNPNLQTSSPSSPEVRVRVWSSVKSAVSSWRHRSLTGVGGGYYPLACLRSSRGLLPPRARNRKGERSTRRAEHTSETESGEGALRTCSGRGLWESKG